MADTLAKTIRNLIVVGKAQESKTIQENLVNYPLSNTLAVFQGRAPSDHVGAPYLTFTLNETSVSSEQHHLKRELSLQFDVWDLNEGHSYTKLQAVIRALVLLFDRQVIEDVGDYESARAFLQTTTIIEEPDSEDNVVRMMALFNIIAYRKYMQTFLVGV